MSDPESISRLMRDSAVVIPGLTGVIWVVGPDAITFVDGLVSQNVVAMSPGETRPGLLLAPNGKLRAPLQILRGESRLGLACDAGRIEVVYDDLKRFKIRVDVSIDIEVQPIWDVWGVDAQSLFTSSAAHGRWIAEEPVVFDRPFARSDLPRIVVIGDQPPFEPVTPGEVHATRIEVGEPIMGVDLTDKTIPQEGVDVAATVDFAKGCYLGQELVARIDSRGHVNQRLVGVVFAGRDLPEPQTQILFQAEPVGVLTSVGWSAVLDSPVALGMVRVAVQSEAIVEVGDAVGTVTDLPLVRYEQPSR